MNKGEYVKCGDNIYKILAVEDDDVFVINCLKQTMPKWQKIGTFDETVAVRSEVLPICRKESELNNAELAVARKRYSVIAGILPFIGETEIQNAMINKCAEMFGVSRRTVTGYLCKYLVFEDIGALSDQVRKKTEKPLTQDQKNMRWALNKFYYNRKNNPLTVAYVQMLKEKYTDEKGKLLPGYPSMNQFRYWFRKTRKKQIEIISRQGIKEYNLNYRPLLGIVQDMATCIGWGMLDSTVCDLYLIDDSGHLVGRPVLQVCVDAFEGFCCGYSLLWEGGVYSVRELMLNTITDKVEWCRRFGISITPEQWNCQELPGVIMTDRGSEFISYNFEQITELGPQLISLPSFSANMKGQVEKLFDLIQESYKPYLKGKGIIEPDFQKRGAVDYRKQACLTMEQFERIVIRCIIYHNCQHILENFPFTEQMLRDKVKPYASDIWSYCRKRERANLIPVTQQQLILTLLPRTEGKFTRQGLKVNGMRYRCDGYTEQYLSGGTMTVAYNPDDVSEVYLVKDDYQKFELIERRYQGESLVNVETLKADQAQYTKSFSQAQLQAKIDLANSIEVIAGHSNYSNDVQMEDIRKTRQRARIERHRDLVQEVIGNEE